jgi:Bacterial Ig-like domain
MRDAPRRLTTWQNSRELGTVVVEVVVDMVNPTITVYDPLSGRLSPQSDTGISQNDAITNINTPTFMGNTLPGATVEVFAAAYGSVSQFDGPIATGTADGSGVWSATLATSPDVVTVVFRHKVKPLRAGRYLLVINSGDSGNGVEDVAGTALQGNSKDSFGRIRLRITTMF